MANVRIVNSHDQINVVIQGYLEHATTEEIATLIKDSVVKALKENEELKGKITDALAQAIEKFDKDIVWRGLKDFLKEELAPKPLDRR